MILHNIYYSNIIKCNMFVIVLYVTHARMHAIISHN